jgi:hypothetical protein
MLGFEFMASLENIDLLIGQALEHIDEAAGEIKEIGLISQKDQLMRLGRAICELWEVREEIYKIKPEIKRDFVKEHSENKQRFENLSALFNKGFEAEKNGDIEEAGSAYGELLNISKFGYFKSLAEAGLYRVKNQLSAEKT